MNISPYPRVGEKLAPLTLREILLTSVPMPWRKRTSPAGMESCADLDGRVWKIFTREECEILAKVIISQVSQNLLTLPDQVATRSLPSSPLGTTLQSLPLAKRTYMALKRQGYDGEADKLAAVTVGEILRVRNFGALALVDLLTALEESASRQPKLQQLEIDLGLGTESTAKNDNQSAQDSVQPVYLEDELHQIASTTASTERNTLFFMQYHGWDGRGSATLQEVGDQYGLTRERVRQICRRVEKRLNSKQINTPILDKALEVIEEQVPGRKDELERLLLERGITRTLFLLEGIKSAAGLLNRPLHFMIANIRGMEVVYNRETSRVVDLVIKLARKTTSHFGAGTVIDLTAQVQEQTSTPVDEEMIAHFLEGRQDFHWLDSENGWFWLDSPARNRLLNTIEKIMSVAGQIDVSRLRDGVRRHHRTQGFAPPRRVLLELCRQLPNYRTTEDIVIADPPLDWKQVLDGVEATMVRILKTHGPVMQSGDLEQKCTDSGMNRSTFFVYLTYSPVIERFARGVYGLRGCQVTPGAVESLASAPARRPVLQDFGWTEDGKIWIGYQVSETMLRSGVVYVPSAVKQFIDGEYSLKPENSNVIGVLATNADSYNAWGLGTFFRRRGGDAGDYLVLVFDLINREVTVHLSDENILEEFHVWE